MRSKKITFFEQYRRSLQDVEAIAFDQLYERVCFIVDDCPPRPAAVGSNRRRCLRPGQARINPLPRG
jgi:hypothetical protein